MTARWGPLGWMTLHSISANYPDYPSPSDKAILRKFMDLFADTISCPSCKLHFGSMFHTYITRTPSWADSKRDLFVFVCRAHNTVNIRLDKPRPKTVQECIDTLQSIARVTSAQTYREKYLSYLLKNWSYPDASGFIMSRSVREMIKINADYWNPRETNFEVSFPEVDILQPIIAVKDSRGKPLPGLTDSGAPVKVGFTLRSGRFSLIGR